MLPGVPAQQLDRPRDLRGNRRRLSTAGDPVTTDNPLAEFEIGSGAQRGSRLTLYVNRLTYQGGDTMESVPLAQLAAVRVAFERDPRKLNWAIGLLLLTLVLAALSGRCKARSPRWRRESATPDGASRLTHVVRRIQRARGIRQLLPGIAVALALVATALLVFFWLGATVLSLAFAATERSYAVLGRNRLLIDFAHVVAEQLARRGN